MKTSALGVAASALLVLSLAVVAPWSASAVVVSPGSGVADLTSQICASAPTGARLCYPLSTSHYVQCTQGKGRLVACPTGRIYDYAKRSCRSSRSAVPCPSFVCPTATRTFNLTLGKPPLSPPYGKFGEVGSYNISFPTPGKYAVFCPVAGHCTSGMTFTVNVYKGRAVDPKYVSVEFEEPLKNTDLVPKRYPDINLPVGGTLNIHWDEPIHFVAVYNITAGVTLPNSPYPPQPRYRCPDWKVINNGTFIEILPNEERLVNFRIPPVANYTWTATTTGTRWFVCPLGTHCRLGQVFKVVIRPRPTGRAPERREVTWTLTGSNYPDLTLYKGDTLFFNILGVHALSVVKSMRTYEY